MIEDSNNIWTFWTLVVFCEKLIDFTTRWIFKKKHFFAEKNDFEQYTVGTVQSGDEQDFREEKQEKQAS